MGCLRLTQAGGDELISSELVRCSMPIKDPIPVLLVSSRADDHELFPSLLKSLDCVILHASNCAEAAGIIQQYPVPTVVTDHKLPDGLWTVVQSVRGFSTILPNVIVLDLPKDPNFFADALARGAFDVLYRPFQERVAIRTITMGYLRWSRSAARMKAREDNLGATALRDRSRFQPARLTKVASIECVVSV
jgi:CheY-like chemotaxis protein